MRDRRDVAKSHETVSEDKPTVAVPPSAAPSGAIMPDDTAPVLAAGEGGERRRQPPLLDLPTRRESLRSVGADARADDTNGVLASGTRDKKIIGGSSVSGDGRAKFASSGPRSRDVCTTRSISGGRLVSR
jgi:hypothetical protein